MNQKCSLALTLCLFLASSPSVAEVVELFDGKTLDGWTRYGGKHEYSVRDGAVIGKVVVGETSSYLCTDRQFGDFELQFEVKYLVGGVNSGCQIRSLIRKEDGEKNFMKKGSIYGNEDIYKTNSRGMLGLQIHKVKEGTGPYEIAWKNIRIIEFGDEKSNPAKLTSSTANR